MKKLLSSAAILSGLSFSLLSCQSLPLQPVQTISGIQNLASLQFQSVALTGQSELHLTDAKAPLAGNTVDLRSPDAWLFLDNIRPATVLSDVLPNVRVNGAAAILGVNVRVAEYGEGSVVIAQGDNYAPMQIWKRFGFAGKSMSLPPQTYWDSSSLGTLNKSVGSFKLKRGYMATIAQNPDGTGASRVYIAQDGDLAVSALPAEFKEGIGFIRVLPWQWTGKRGWCGENPELQVDPLWWYNWGTTSVSRPNIEFVPMKWDDKGTTYLNINNKAGSTHLLGFNEPNGSDQANMTTDQAIAEWPKLQQSGLRLGSPAPTDGGANWLFDFMDKADAKGLRVDYVAVHFYRCGQSADQLYNWLKGIHERTGRPIWITEYNNGANWTTCPDPTLEQNAKVIGEWSDMMEATPWIERYSVYNWVEDVRAMVLQDQLTPAGRVYRAKHSNIAYRQELPNGADANARYIFNGDAADATLGGNDGMIVGAPRFVAGKAGAAGQAIELDGARDTVQLPASVGDGAEFSFAGWVNWKGGAAFQRIFDLGDGPDRYLFLTPSSDAQTLRFAITTDGTGKEQRLDTRPLPPGVWTHVAVTIKNGVGKLFVNGELAATNPNMTTSADKVKTRFNYLGKSQFADPLFAGALQEISFASTALSDAQVKTLANNSNALLPAFWVAPEPAPIRGLIGVGTWGTQAEFKDIKVTQNGKTLYASDFSKGLAGWKTPRGEWEVVDGALRQTSASSNTLAIFGDAGWDNYTITLQARKLSGDEGFLITFGAPDAETVSRVNFGGWGNTAHAIQSSDIETARVPGTIETGRWYSIKIELQGPKVNVYLNNKLVQSATR